ncbi:MAG: periplasmic heavy metal sensor [Candidatus Omnitrophota bacterium]
MCRRMNIVSYVCALLAAGIFSGAAYLPSSGDAPQGKAAESKAGGPFREMAKELNLSVEQIRMIEDNRRQHMEQGRRLMVDMMKNRDDLRRELAGIEPDMEKVMRIQQRIKSLLSEREDSRLQGMMDLKKILTPEQFAAFNRKIEEKMRRRPPPRGMPPFEAPSGP